MCRGVVDDSSKSLKLEHKQALVEWSEENKYFSIATFFYNIWKFNFIIRSKLKFNLLWVFYPRCKFRVSVCNVSTVVNYIWKFNSKIRSKFKVQSFMGLLSTL